MAAYWLDAENYDGKMTSYVVDGEALETYTSWFPFEVPTERIVIGKDNNESDISLKERINRHMIEEVIEILKKEITQ